MTAPKSLLRPHPLAVGPEDGRKVRRDRNRAAVVDALLELYSEGRLDPSSDEIATRAGLSPRSLFRYFDDIDDLCQSAIHRQHERVRHLFDVDADPEASLEIRIEALVLQRVTLFEAIEGAAQVARIRQHFQPVVAAELAQSRALFRAQIKRLMKRELTLMTPSQSVSALSAVDVLCSFESYQLLRGDSALSRPKAQAALADALRRLLTSDDAK